MSSTFAAILTTLLVIAATATPAHAKKKAKQDSSAKRETTFSAIDDTNTEVADDESDFASAKPEKHKAAARAQQDPIDAMAAAIRLPAANQHRNTSVGNSSDLQPFTELEVPK